MKRNGRTDNFATWIRDRIAQYDFVENQDFVTFSENSEKGRPHPRHGKRTLYGRAYLLMNSIHF